MRKQILITLLTLPLLAVAAHAGRATYMQTWDSMGSWGDDFGGSSYLGVDTRDVTSDRLGPLHLKEEQGVEVTMVDQDAPAGKAGLKEQDVILTLNGEKVESVEQLRRMIRETPPGRTVTLGVSRNGQPMAFKIQLEDRKSSFSYAYGPKAKDFHFEMPPMPVIPDIDIPVSIVVVHSSVRSGLMVENLTPQLGDFFGAKNGEGVLVRSVEKGSRAEKAGLHAGDVIVRINDEAIHDSGDFSHALRGRKDNTAKLSILRDKKEQTITLTLPERKQSELLRESLEVPEIDAQTREELGHLGSEMARLKPEIEQMVREETEMVKPEVMRHAREVQKHSVELKKQAEEIRRAVREQEREIEREFRTQDSEEF